MVVGNIMAETITTWRLHFRHIKEGKGVAGDSRGTIFVAVDRSVALSQPSGKGSLVFCYCIRVFAIFPNSVGLKIHTKYYYETDELPNPKANPTPEKIC